MNNWIKQAAFLMSVGALPPTFPEFVRMEPAAKANMLLNVHDEIRERMEEETK